MIATLGTIAGRFILAPLASLWRWLTADPIRMAFAALIALCGFLALRLSMVDGDRDDWRDKARAYEAASKAIEEADVKADAAGTITASETKKDIDDGNKRAEEAARNSDDGLAAAFDELRRQAAGEGDEAAR